MKNQVDSSVNVGHQMNYHTNNLFVFFALLLIVNNNNGIVWVFLDGVEPYQGWALWPHP